jgi:hypothetical protein
VHLGHGGAEDGFIGHVSQDDEVTEIANLFGSVGLEMMKQRAGRAQITIKRGDRLWPYWLASRRLESCK